MTPAAVAESIVDLIEALDPSLRKEIIWPMYLRMVQNQDAEVVCKALQNLQQVTSHMEPTPDQFKTLFSVFDKLATSEQSQASGSKAHKYNTKLVLSENAFTCGGVDNELTYPLFTTLVLCIDENINISLNSLKHLDSLMNDRAAKDKLSTSIH